jgi:hypothetical protein
LEFIKEKQFQILQKQANAKKHKGGWRVKKIMKKLTESGLNKNR